MKDLQGLLHSGSNHNAYLSIYEYLCTIYVLSMYYLSIYTQEYDNSK